ncbi:MAG: hypothetical protein JO021_16065 [Alphaproteobacteria bacterium]|nr:hypothetical protein [Alphaproteobacteria bacterium]
MKIEAPKSLVSSPQADETLHRMTLEGLADVDAGRVVDHRVVRTLADDLTGKSR